jgi:hypothetical protein
VIQTLCLLVALVFALLATAAVPQPPRFHFLSFAVAMLVLALLVGHTIGGYDAQRNQGSEGRAGATSVGAGEGTDRRACQ